MQSDSGIGHAASGMLAARKLQGRGTENIPRLRCHRTVHKHNFSVRLNFTPPTEQSNTIRIDHGYHHSRSNIERWMIALTILIATTFVGRFAAYRIQKRKIRGDDYLVSL